MDNVSIDDYPQIGPVSIFRNKFCHISVKREYLMNLNTLHLAKQ